MPYFFTRGRATHRPMQPSRRALSSTKVALAICLLVSVLGSVGLSGASNAARGGAAYVPQPGKRVAVLGTDGQFSDAQFQDLATNFGYVLFSKGHGNGNINLAHEAATRLVELNPSINVFPYFSTKLWFDGNDEGWAEPGFTPTFDREWLLRDQSGNLVPQANQRLSDNSVYYIDLADPAYRDWALTVLGHWMEMAPYGGIRFDSGNFLANGFDAKNWVQLLGQARVDAYNAGIRDLMTRAAQLLGPDQEVIFNGISPAAYKGPDRSLSVLDYVDGATDEAFCYGTNAEVVLAADIEIMQSNADKTLLLFTDPEGEFTETEILDIGNFCFASFLMGWQPGSSYFKFAPGSPFGVGQLDELLSEINLNLGAPLGAYTRVGDLLSRTFANGTVHVNHGSSAVAVPITDKLVLMANGAEVATYAPGDTFTLQPEEGAFFLRHRFRHPRTRTAAG
ncbi:hypothetical protein BH18ACT4_BH18ACT4_16030 [soil metagenome]